MKPVPSFSWEALERERERMGATQHIRPAGSFTVNEYAARFSCSRAAASRELDIMLKQGRVTRVRIAMNGRAGWCYTLVEKRHGKKA